MAILTDVSIAEYHAQTTRCSHSRFRDFVTKGPRFFFEKYIAKTIPHAPTEAMIMGDLLETLVQQGDAAFEAKVYHQREDGRKIKPQLDAARGAGLHILKADAYTRLQAMRASLLDCTDGMELVEPADMQATITGDAFGLPMQSRPDWLNLEGLARWNYRPYTVDLKKCADLDGLRGDASKLFFYGYHTQAALARALLRNNGYEESEHFLLAVEEQGAHRSTLIRLRPELLDWADQYFLKYAPALEQCLRTNAWPRVEPTCEVGLPRWVTNTNASDEIYEADDQEQKEPAE